MRPWCRAYNVEAIMVGGLSRLGRSFYVEGMSAPSSFLCDRSVVTMRALRVEVDASVLPVSPAPCGLISDKTSPFRCRQIEEKGPWPRQGSRQSKCGPLWCSTRSDRYCPSCAFIASSICRLTASRLNEAGVCIGGKSTAVRAKSATFCWTRTKRQNSRA
jgi:hypothetical protein